MTFEEQLKHLPSHIIGALFREKMLAQGRCDAFVFVQECQGDMALIREKLTEYEEMIAHPTGVWIKALMPNTSVRLHKDGFMAGLRDALKILEQADASAPRTAVPAPARAPRLAIAEGHSPYDTPSELGQPVPGWEEGSDAWNRPRGAETSEV